MIADQECSGLEMEALAFCRAHRGTACVRAVCVRGPTAIADPPSSDLESGLPATRDPVVPSLFSLLLVTWNINRRSWAYLSL